MKANEALYTNTMGLCGTFNHNVQDEFLCPGGDVDQQVESFVRQWANAECTDVRPATQQCDEAQPHWRESKKLCRQLYLNSFAGCHEAVHPEQFFELCIQAACSCASDARDCICPVLSHYAHACAQRGHVLDWRNDVPQCGVSCENGQSYRSCASVCDSSCSLIGRNVSCASRCVEGCACGPGHSADSRGHCVPVSECGCLFRGHEFPAGFKQRRHSEHCECSGGKWHCRPANTDDVIFLPSTESCAANEEYTECLSTCPRTCSTLNKQDGPECAVDVCQAGCQ
ncbi:von Willebrand factor-like [Ixodes scapularis]|uniref:von Willebrand factor-like n=1 Tax=Ixodes scapularis TaxID=6945 RepID=UPI001C3917DB|nr:von Willebrand factor-like [Ixodes scapularis]